jgi:gamma-glutamyl-gamma-aminobutyrate hydrolase PuuD
MTHLVAVGNCMGAPSYFKHLFDSVHIIDNLHAAKALVSENSVIMYGGGEDISPSLYGAVHNPKTHAPKQPSQRDALEKAIFELGVERGSAHYGICRGHQLLAALLGGRLFQHIHNHHMAHEVTLNIKAVVERPLELKLKNWSDLFKTPKFMTTSVHHQAVDINSLMDKYYTIPVLSNKCLSHVYELGDEKLTAEEVEEDNEAFFVPVKRVFGVQGHPEFARRDSPFVQFCQTMMTILIEERP